MLIAHDIGRHLGCYDVPETGTANIDSLAADSVLFARFHGAPVQPRTGLPRNRKVPAQ
jgi:hypothetical protein